MIYHIREEVMTPSYTKQLKGLIFIYHGLFLKILDYKDISF